MALSMNTQTGLRVSEEQCWCWSPIHDKQGCASVHHSRAPGTRLSSGRAGAGSSTTAASRRLALWKEPDQPVDPAQQI